ncbi:acyl-CoA dehydrogenase family protein [Actinomadura mexicana]|uniref:Acyl-CoA dehydrogenase, C-terminal domain n=1 Tax=Actinomadura mexicana TaxID=134959 RepID=A0A239C2C2_9ACTN|nr:acyl-CoA dehydrogenase family protein [Actinomadura mexicana]SNS13523.1 Acyl-CoA dehydrogenase, C-terminal domain [Actinomadura mexicana]
MKREWAPAALALRDAVRAVLADRGGVEIARSAEERPRVRGDDLRPALESVGVLDLDPLGDAEESEAAMLAVRACGAVVAPWPVARALTVPVKWRARWQALYVVDGPVSHLEHADLFENAGAVPLGGDPLPRAASPTGSRGRAPLDPFGVPVEIRGPVGAAALPDRALLMSFVLDGFWMAGALETVALQAAGYAGTRRQFGKPIGRFGEIRWRLADIAVATDGLDELATYTWFQVHRGRATLADAFALRLGMLEAADSVLRHAHQVFGAIGLCEEHDLTLLDRHLTPALLRPASLSRTRALLLEAVNRHGFRGTFDVPHR